MTERGLPRGWAWTTLGEIVGIEAGKSFAAESRSAEDDEWGIIKVSAMTYGEFRPHENKAVVDPSRIDERFRIQCGDILLSRANTAQYVGASVLVHTITKKLLLSDKSLRLIPSSLVDRRWFALFLASPDVRSQISAKATGTKDSMRNIPQNELRRLPVALPPLAEQRRIVAVLEDHLSRLDAAEESLGTISPKIEAIRRARPDPTNPQHGFPSRPLASLLREPLRNGHSGRVVHASENGVRAITLTAVTKGDFSDHNTKLTDTPRSKAEQLWLEDGDIFIQRANTPELVGTSAVYRGPSRWAIFPDLLIRVRVTRDVLPDFLAEVLQAESTKAYFRRSARGLAGSMPKINQDTVERVPVPVPSIDQQRTWVDSAHESRAGLSRLMAAAAATTARSATLRRSLLRAAFNGELVDQDPSDEAADVALAKLRAEEAVNTARRRSRSAAR